MTLTALAVEVINSKFKLVLGKNLFQLLSSGVSISSASQTELNLSRWKAEPKVEVEFSMQIFQLIKVYVRINQYVIEP